MLDHTPLPFDLPSVCRKKLTVDFNGGNQSSNGGLLLLREKERALGVCRRLAERCPIAAMLAKVRRPQARYAHTVGTWQISVDCGLRNDSCLHGLKYIKRLC
jgi:hypothetical protein